MKSLEDISISMAEIYPIKDDIFTNSTNEWIKRHSNVMKGKIGEELMIEYMDAYKSKTKYEYDICKDDKNIEVKLSCLNETGLFKWLNIRSCDGYTHICLIGIEPECINAYLVPKKDLSNTKTGAGGKRSDNDNTYLGMKPDAEWLKKFKI